MPRHLANAHFGRLLGFRVGSRVGLGWGFNKLFFFVYQPLAPFLMLASAGEENKVWGLGLVASPWKAASIIYRGQTLQCKFRVLECGVRSEYSNQELQTLSAKQQNNSAHAQNRTSYDRQRPTLKVPDTSPKTIPQLLILKSQVLKYWVLEHYTLCYLWWAFREEA